MSSKSIVVGGVIVALDGVSGKLEVMRSGQGITSSGHGLDIQRCKEVGEALKRLTPAVEDRSGAFLLAMPPVHLGLRLGAIALAEGLITEKVELPRLNWIFDFFGKSDKYQGRIEVGGKIYPLTIHETNFVSGRSEIRVDW